MRSRLLSKGPYLPIDKSPAVVYVILFLVYPVLPNQRFLECLLTIEKHPS